MPRKKSRSGVEWVGGLVPLPGEVKDEGEVFQPNVLVWLDADRAMVGHHVAKPEELLESAAPSLRAAIDAPLTGRPHAPARVRVASEDLAEATRVAHPDIEFVVAPTPELDLVRQSMQAFFEEEGGALVSYLDMGRSPEGCPNPAGLASFFEAAAELYRAAPWAHLSDTAGSFAVTIDDYGVDRGILTVVGQQGESFGLLLFESFDDFDAYGAMIDEHLPGEDIHPPPHGMLSFDPPDELPAHPVDEVKEQRWELAGPAAYPWLAYFDDDGDSRPPTAEELSTFEAICRAMAELFADGPEVRRAVDDGSEIRDTSRVNTHAGSVAVTLQYPHPDDEFEGPDLGLSPSSRAEQAFERLDQVLLHHFARTKDGKRRARNCQLAMRLSLDRFGVPLAVLTEDELCELVFGFLPRSVPMEPSEAGAFIDDLRSFARYVHREHGYDEAVGWLEVLDRRAASELEAALSDPRDFGPAKALMMAGKEAGFDMDSVEGIESFLRTDPKLPDSVPIGPRSVEDSGSTEPPPPSSAPRKKGPRKSPRKKSKDKGRKGRPRRR